MNNEIKEGDKVVVPRQIGKNGTAVDINGVIKHFSSTITIGGERTAYVECDDEQAGQGYWYPLSKIKIANHE